MHRHLLRIEGVNHGASYGDTNDLSTIRGGSLALLKIGEVTEKAIRGVAGVGKVERVFSGASLAALLVENDLDDFPEEVRRAIANAFSSSEHGLSTNPDAQLEPLNYLTVVVDAVPTEVASVEGKAIDGAVLLAEAKNLARQFREWTVPPLPNRPVAEGARIEADYLEAVRPATVPIKFYPSHVLLNDIGQARTRYVSASVAARHNFGRKQRQKFYDKLLQDEGYDGLNFTETVSDIAEVQSEDYRAPISLRNKLAVFYADGNGFGSIRREIGNKPFSDKLGAYRKGLMRAILDWYRFGSSLPFDSGPHDNAFAVYNPSRQSLNKMDLRFETLLFGGDELCFVLPAWLAVPFVKGFFDVTRDWKIEGHPLTHAASVVIAHHKTPIRQMRAIAHGSANLSKEAGDDMRKVNSVTFEIYESLSPVDDVEGAFQSERFRLYGNNDAFGDEGGQAAMLNRWLALPGGSFDKSVGSLRTWQRPGADGFPRSQVYKMIRAMRAEATSSLWNAKADEIVDGTLTDYDRRVPGSKKFVTDSDHRLGQIGPERPLSLELAMIATLWDYFTDLGMPDFTDVTSIAKRLEG